MAPLPKIRKIFTDDYKDAPLWFSKFIITINLFLDAVYYALNRNLSFNENINSQIITIPFIAKASAAYNKLNFATDLKSVNGIIIIKAVQKATTYTVLASAINIPSWRYLDGQIYVDSITGLTAAATYDLTFLVI